MCISHLSSFVVQQWYQSWVFAFPFLCETHLTSCLLVCIILCPSASVCHSACLPVQSLFSLQLCLQFFSTCQVCLGLTLSRQICPETPSPSSLRVWVYFLWGLGYSKVCAPFSTCLSILELSHPLEYCWNHFSEPPLVQNVFWVLLANAWVMCTEVLLLSWICGVISEHFILPEYLLCRISGVVCMNPQSLK